MTVSLVDGPHATLRLVEGDNWGTALLIATGGQGHLAAVAEKALGLGWQLDESGLTAVDANAGTGNDSLGRADVQDGIRVFDCEEALYDFIGLQWIPPELREGDGEIEAASGRQLPHLIAGKEILGEVHGHTTWSDGKSSVAEMAEAARSRGYRFWAVTDHSVGLGVTRGVDAEALLEQRREIDAVNENYAALGIDFRLIQGTEVEVLGDGELGLPDDVLASLDVVVASVHSGLRQDRQRITERCLKAVHNPLRRHSGAPDRQTFGSACPFRPGSRSGTDGLC